MALTSCNVSKILTFIDKCLLCCNVAVCSAAFYFSAAVDALFCVNLCKKVEIFFLLSYFPFLSLFVVGVDCPEDLYF